MRKFWTGNGPLGLVMVVSILVCVGMVTAQVVFGGDDSNTFLVWNLFLALVPQAIAGAAGSLTRRRGSLGWGTLAFFSFSWLVFFPNATYVVTDVFHLAERATPSRWDGLYYDLTFWSAVLIWAFFAFVAHLSGLLSLAGMHRLWAKKAGKAVGWLLVSGACLSAGAGIFLGRFARVNSWHVITHPLEVLRPLRWFFESGVPLVFALAFGLFIFLTYLILRFGSRQTAGE